MLQALLVGTLHRLRERLPGTVNDTEQFRSIRTYPLAEIAVPLLAIHGTGDRVVPFAHGQALASAVAGAEFLQIENGEHVSLFTHLDEVRARVRSFLARHRPTRG